MRANDARRLDHATLEAMRERAVRSVQDGENPEVVADVLGINRSTIYGWLAQYRRGGWGALKAKPLFGRPPKLDGEILAFDHATFSQALAERGKDIHGVLWRPAAHEADDRHCRRLRARRERPRRC